MLRWIVTVLFLWSSGAAAAIVNIEDLRPQDQQVGESGKFDLSFSRSQGNSNVLTLQAQNGLVWTRERSESLFILNYRYGESSGEVNVNQGLGHLRHVRPVAERLATEVFLQAQKDEFKRLTYRLLAGGNFRLALVQGEERRMFWGLGGFHSHENLSGIEGWSQREENTFRMNSYFSYRESLNEDASVATTVYYQPRLDRWQDFHILWDSSVRVDLVRSLQLRISYEVLFDSRPPTDVAGTDERFFSGVSWSY